MDQLQELVTNKYVVGFLVVGTTLYASLARPELPPVLVKMFDYTIVKLIFYLLIVWLMTQNIQVAIVVAMGFYLLMDLASTQRLSEQFIRWGDRGSPQSPPPF